MPAVERAVGIARILQGAADDFQAQKLHGIDRVHRLRNDVVFQRIEDDGVDEPAPFRINLVARLLVGIVIATPVPAFGRHFADRVDLVQHIFPERVEVRGLREDAAHADDGDVAGPSGKGSAGVRLRNANRFEPGRAFGGNRMVQFFDGAGFSVQGDDLAGHEDAVLDLFGRRDLEQHRHGRVFQIFHVKGDALGGDAQAAEVQQLQGIPDFFRGFTFLLHPAFFLLERLGERAGGRADFVAIAAVEHVGVAGFEQAFLVAFANGAGAYRFPGQQIGRAHQHADVHAAFDERRRHRGDHRGGHRVADAAGEPEVELARRFGGYLLE